MCCLSLPLCLRLTPNSHLHTSPLLSVTLRCPVSILVPGAGGGASPCSAQVRRHGLPRASHWAWVLQGLRETTGWEPSGQGGGAMEDVLPETLGDRLTGKDLRHLDPGEPISQHKEASVNQCYLLK